MLPILRSGLLRPVRRARVPFDALWDEMDRWASDLFHDGAGVDRSFEPVLDVTEDENAVSVRAEVPGMDPKDIHIEVDEGVLTLRGEKKEEKDEQKDGRHWTERRYGSFARAISLPAYVDAGKVEAKYKDGVLSITLPKTEQAKPKQVEVKAG